MIQRVDRLAVEVRRPVVVAPVAGGRPILFVALRPVICLAALGAGPVRQCPLDICRPTEVAAAADQAAPAAADLAVDLAAVVAVPVVEVAAPTEEAAEAAVLGAVEAVPNSSTWSSAH
jgi:hypothetical protein